MAVLGLAGDKGNNNKIVFHNRVRKIGQIKRQGLDTQVEKLLEHRNGRTGRKEKTEESGQYSGLPLDKDSDNKIVFHKRV